MRFSSDCRRCLVGSFLVMLAFGPTSLAQTPTKEPTAEQKEKVRERDAFLRQGSQYFREGKYPEAITAAQKALAIEREFGADRPDEVWILEKIASVHIRTEDFAAAQAVRRDVLRIQTKMHGESSWQGIDARLNLEHMETLAKLDRKARQELAEADQWMAKAIAANKPGSYQEGAEWAEKSLAIRVRLLGEDHRLSALSATLTGHLWRKVNQLEKARPFSERGAASYMKVLGENHPETAMALNFLGSFLHTRGDFAAARPQFEKALAIYQKTLGGNHPEIAKTMDKLGALLLSQGDYAAARPFFEQALAMNRKLLGPNHPETASSSSNLGLLLHSQRDFAAARPYYEQALAIHKRVSGEDHSETATCLNNLGMLLFSQGDMAVSQPYFEQVAAIRKKMQGESHPDTAAALNNLGYVLFSQGEYAAARPHLEQALLINKKLLGENHPHHATFLTNLGRLLLMQEEYAAARSYLEQASALSRHALALAAIGQSERQQLLMSEALRYQFHAFLNLPNENETQTGKAYAQMLVWKGAILARQQRIRLERQDPKSAPLVDEIRLTTGQLASLAFATPDPGKHEAWNRQLEELTHRKEALERELAQKSPSFRKDQELANLTPQEFLRTLPPDTALVDFIVYGRYKSETKRNGRPGAADHLAAFVLKPGAAIERIELGPMEPIENAIDEWHRSVKKHAEKNHPGLELRRLLWLPLEKNVAGVKTILVSPDGALGRIPFPALPGSKEGSYLLEEVALAVIPVPSSVPDLLKKQALEPSLLLVGDVDFDADAGTASPHNQAAAEGTRNGERFRWQSLPGTVGEVAAISDSFAQRFGAAKSKVLRGDKATQENFCDLAPKHTYLHLATHGFFAPPTVPSVLRSDKSNHLASGLFDKQGVTGFHPGLLSGLVLAGANKAAKPGQSDGILTAMEVAELDLRKVELAVLSACETGLGKVAAGEGILGLQRAFQVAGTRSAVTSLWSVPDEPTRVLMERFYENLWSKKMSKLDSLLEAQRWMLNEGRSHDRVSRGIRRLENAAEPAATGRLPPYYWAAFVMSGDWR
jgi:CHAT domain-containing protein